MVGLAKQLCQLENGNPGIVVPTAWLYDFLDKEVELKGFDIERENAVVVICKSGKKTVRISLASIEWPKLTKLQKLFASGMD